MIKHEIYELICDLQDKVLPLLTRIAEAVERIADNEGDYSTVSEEDREVLAELEEKKRKLQEDIDEIRRLEERAKEELKSSAPIADEK